MAPDSFIRLFCDVRTEYLLKNLYAHLLGPYGTFERPWALNAREAETLRVILGLVNDMKQEYASRLEPLLDADFYRRAHFSEERDLYSFLLRAFQEIFSMGISWNSIIGYFLFVGELLTKWLREKRPRPFVPMLYAVFAQTVKERLEPWVEDHGGWYTVFVTCLPSVESQPRWKRMLYNCVRLFGTYAAIQNLWNRL